jgi:hypothetical protein
MRPVVPLLLIAFATATIPVDTATAINSEIRFYKANKKLQQDRIMAFGKGDELGCHDFLKSTRVHRIANYGYQFCVVYSERNCEAGSEISAHWKEDAETKTELTQGARWFPVREDIRGTRIGSWNCVLETPEDEVAEDTAQQ